MAKILGKPHHFPRFYYSYEVSAGSGGGRSCSSGSYTTGETAIKADIETRGWRSIKIIMDMKNYKILFVFITLIALLGIIAMSQVVKNRGGVNVKCSVEHPVSDKIVSYRQDDESWKDIHLGNSKYTMESSGCITTCIATAVSETDRALTPAELVNLLSEKGVFDSEGNMQWGALDEIPGFEVTVYSDLSADYIDECLSAGHYPIVKVHRKSLFSYHHFVLIVGAEDGEYICMDPLMDGYTKLSDYGNRIYSIRCVWYEE